MYITTFMCPHCKKEHHVREVTAFAAETDNVLMQTQIEEADFYDTESLNLQKEAKAELEKEYGRPVDFVIGQYSGWCLRPEGEGQ